ncbi:MAG: uracil phosphoribosyltransferase [Rhodobacteraceae bacterium]|nr:uracil phosphoribosyltransferase [Paracoccaceae bacterium]
MTNIQLSATPLHKDTLHVLPQTNGLRGIHSAMRDRMATQDVFVFNARRVTRLLMEFALDFLPHENIDVKTPSGGVYKGVQLAMPFCGVSILRAGDSMEIELREIAPQVPLGKMLIQRDPVTKLPKFFFAKLPEDIATRQVLLLDPMLATGGTAVEAINQLIAHGAKPENIVFVTILSVADGLNYIMQAHPEVRILTSAVEDCLNEHAFMLPGIGDFGDRFFGTYTPPTVIK